MRCDETQERVSLLVDFDLDEAEKGPMFRHLEGCAECRGFMESMIRLRKGVAAERDALLREADGLLPASEEILRRARRAEASPPLLRRLLQGGFRLPVPIAVGVAILLLLVGIVLGARIPAGAGRAISPAARVEPVSRSDVVVVCGMPEVEVVGYRPRR